MSTVYRNDYFLQKNQDQATFIMFIDKNEIFSLDMSAVIKNDNFEQNP